MFLLVVNGCSATPQIIQLSINNLNHTLNIKPLGSSHITTQTPIWVLATLKSRPDVCSFDLRSAIMVAVSLWSNIMPTTKLSGFFCSRTIEHWSKPADKNSRFSHDIIIEKDVIAHGACEFMSRERHCPKGNKLVALNATTMGTNHRPLINDSLLASHQPWTQVVHNYYLHRVEFTLDSFTNFVQAPLLVNLDQNCAFKDQYCYGDQGVLVWNIPLDSSDHCQFNYHHASDCYLSSSQLICPELKISVMSHLDAVYDSCGTDLGYVRASVQDHTGDLEPVSHALNLTEEYGMELDFHRLLSMVTIGKPSYIKLLHIASCQTYPTQLHYEPAVADHYSEVEIIDKALHRALLPAPERFTRPVSRILKPDADTTFYFIP